MYDFERQLRNNAINVGSYVGLYPPIKSRGLKEIQKEIKNGFSTSFDDYILHCAGEAPVYFTPLKPYSTVTPHSLRATLDTHLSLVLGADFVGKIMTGQTENVVNYYSKITPERFEKVMAVKDQLIDAFPTVIGVNDMAKDINAVQEAIEESGIIGLDGFRLHSNASEKEYMPETINPNDVAINSTHICIHGNRCPKDIINKIGEKNCAICPVAISTTSDLIAITAQIRFHRDNILDINGKLSVNDLNKTEKQTLIRMRIEECTHAANWYARYQFIVSHHTDKNGYIVLSDGCNGVQEKVEAVKKLTQGQEIFCRLQEVKSTPSLQSDLLKRKASRLSREILKQITNDSFDIPDVNAVDISRQLITKMADLHDIKPSDLEGFLKESELDAARLLSFSVTESLREII